MAWLCSNSLKMEGSEVTSYKTRPRGWNFGEYKSCVRVTHWSFGICHQMTVCYKFKALRIWSLIKCFPSLLCISTGSVASYVYSRYEDDLHDSLFNCGMCYIQALIGLFLVGFCLCVKTNLCVKLFIWFHQHVHFYSNQNHKFSFERFCTKRGIR